MPTARVMSLKVRRIAFGVIVLVRPIFFATFANGTARDDLDRIFPVTPRSTVAIQCASQPAITGCAACTLPDRHQPPELTRN